MHRIVGGVLVLVAGMALAAAEAVGQDSKPATPEQQHRALLEQYDAAFQEYAKAYGAAKTPQEQQAVVENKYPWPDKYAAKFLALAEKHPKGPAAEEALIWIMTNEYQVLRFRPWYEHVPRYEMIRIMTGGGRRWGVPTKEEQEIRGKATDLLLRDHVASPKLGRVVEMLGSSQDKKSAALVRAVHEKNPHKDVKAEACVALALQLQARVALVKQCRNDPQAAKSLEQNYGKDYVAELLKADPAVLEAEAEKLYAELTENHLPNMKPSSAAHLCQRLLYTTDSERLLRVLYTMGKRDEVRGPACLVLAQVLRGSADEKKRKESEKLLETAVDKYADVKTAFDGAVGRKAASELFDLRSLSVGKAAPEIEGTDQHGKPFKLSDYRGKAVLLDFWSEY
ncbi:MAG TPA: redoxin domain-containing protein [Planctomycetia bacterium]|nr:redoxin domain-containing protein [Planctomycetia bacterium]